MVTTERAVTWYEPYVIVTGKRSRFPGWPCFREDLRRICMGDDDFAGIDAAIAYGRDLAISQVRQHQEDGYTQIRLTLNVRKRPPGDLATFFPEQKGGVIYSATIHPKTGAVSPLH